jgi:acetylornithine deacetylase/succinyl-diaminopimelate desuccinylase-like protein
VALTHIKVNITNQSFKPYQNIPGIKLKAVGNISAMKGKGSQPPKNIITNRFDITITCRYSPKNRNAKVIEEYSTLNPDTSSDSA